MTVPDRNRDVGKTDRHSTHRCPYFARHYQCFGWLEWPQLATKFIVMLRQRAKVRGLLDCTIRDSVVAFKSVEKAKKPCILERAGFCIYLCHNTLWLPPRCAVEFERYAIMVPHTLCCAKSKTQEFLKFAKSWPERRFSTISSPNAAPISSQLLPKAIPIKLSPPYNLTVVRIAEHGKAKRAGTWHLLSLEPYDSHSRSHLHVSISQFTLRSRAL